MLLYHSNQFGEDGLPNAINGICRAASIVLELFLAYIVFCITPLPIIAVNWVPCELTGTTTNSGLRSIEVCPDEHVKQQSSEEYSDCR